MAITTNNANRVYLRTGVLLSYIVSKRKQTSAEKPGFC